MHEMLGLHAPRYGWLEGLDIAGKTVTADALLTQRPLARYRFSAKDNPPTLLDDIRLLCEGRGEPGFLTTRPSTGRRSP